MYPDNEFVIIDSAECELMFTLAQRLTLEEAQAFLVLSDIAEASNAPAN